MGRMSRYTAVTAPADSDVFVTVQGGVTKKITYAQLKAGIIGNVDVLIYKGVIACAGNPNYPAADAGHVYKVSSAGRIGGAAGPVVAIGDVAICAVDGSAAGTDAAVGANWNILQGSIDTEIAAAIALTARKPDQGMAMTYAASGSSGILVADNDNIDFGTGNFTLAWKGSLPDWTLTGIDVVLMQKHINSILLRNTDAGLLRIGLNGTSYTSTVVQSFVDGTIHEVVCVVTRSSASVAGSVVFYADGSQLGASVAIPAGAPATVSNSDPLYILGTSAIRYAGTAHHAYTFNRALTAAEVLSLYRNGIDFADKWGSQTSTVTGDSKNFEGNTVGSWLANAAGGTRVVNSTTPIAGTYDLKIDSDGQYKGAYLVVGTVELGKKYRLKMQYKSASGSWSQRFTTSSDPTGTAMLTLPSGASVTNLTADGAIKTLELEFTSASSGSAYLHIYDIVAETKTIYIDEIEFYPIGATLALEPEGIQPAPGQCLDSSSNKLHAMQPSAGSSLTRFKKDFEYRWTNTWTASSAAQYVGGLNQAVLSADHFITDIITQATVTTDVENLELGDGSDVNHFVEAFAPSATRTKQTIAAQNDGTNLKLVYTPAAEATMTVETIIRGFIWEP